mmetsp:Transcript_94832/g.178431  ORF Transcript_94832/g.178431 Transcript_94832/m.178431 type:complete len:317 (+) Transcript_94832:143-1093(+)
MPTKVVEQIKEKVRAGYRSSESVAKREAAIRLSADTKILLVTFDLDADKNEEREKPPSENAQEPGAVLEIIVSEIANIKVKDLFDNQAGKLWILSVILSSQVHHSFQFEKETTRNMWDHGLRSIVFRHASSGHLINQTPGEEVIDGEHSFAKIHSAQMKAPSEGTLVCMVIVFQGNIPEAYLEIPRDRADADHCKRLTEEFVKKYKVAFTHSTSLYRLVRAVTSRALLEQETQQVITEIDNCNSERIYEDLANRDKTSSERAELVVKAQERLDNLINSLPQRMGQTGPAAILVGDMLKRNAMKMKLFNAACKLGVS